MRVCAHIHSCMHFAPHTPAPLPVLRQYLFNILPPTQNYLQQNLPDKPWEDQLARPCKHFYHCWPWQGGKQTTNKASDALLTLNFPVAVVNMLNSSKEISEFSFENADVKSICYCKQRIKSKLSLFFSECVETKLCKPCTSFTWHLHSWCGMVWYGTLRVTGYSYPVQSRHDNVTARWTCLIKGDLSHSATFFCDCWQQHKAYVGLGHSADFGCIW